MVVQTYSLSVNVMCAILADFQVHSILQHISLMQRYAKKHNQPAGKESE